MPGTSWAERSSVSKYTYEQLMEKIIRAKIHLEKAPRTQHSNLCSYEDITGHPAPCTCGAASKNAHVESALEALRL